MYIRAVMLTLFAAGALLSACGGGSSRQGTPTLEPSGTNTTTASRTEAPSVSPTTTPTPAVPGARDVTLAPDGGLPQGSALLIGTAGFHHGGGGFFRLRKVWQFGSAAPTGSAEVIPWNGSPDPNSSILGVAHNEHGTVLWMSRCEGLACYYEGEMPGVMTTFLLSRDGGVSWQEVLRRKGAWWLRTAIGETGYAVNFAGTGALLAVPSGDSVPVPAGAARTEPLPYQGRLAWVSRDGRSLLDATGTAVAPFAIPQGLVLTGDTATWTTPAESLTAWGLFGSDSQTRYIAIVRAGSGTPPVAILRVPLPDARLARWLDEDTLVLTADYPGSCSGGAGGVGGSLPVLLSTSVAAARFVTGPLANCDSAGGQVVLAAWSGLSGQVHTPGDCLNLRQRPEPTAPVIECLADGVLLAVVGKDGVPAGWLPVTAPSGKFGWVSAEFVARQ